MTRAERYKRNYRLIKNTFQNTTLAKRAQTWSDATIYEKLGIKVGGKRTPEIKKLKTKRQLGFYLNNFLKPFDVQNQKKNEAILSKQIKPLLKEI